MMTPFQQDPKAPQLECQPDLQQPLTFTLHRSVGSTALTSDEGMDLGARDALRTPKEPADKVRAAWFDQQWMALSALAQAARR